MMQWEQRVEEILQTHKQKVVVADAEPIMEAHEEPVLPISLNGEAMANKDEVLAIEDGALPKQRFGLGGEHGGAYLTYREAQCMLLFMRGKTVSKVAECLKLSPRTIEFYLNNIKGKVNCRSKSELIEVIIETPFFNVLPQIEKELSFFGVELGDAVMA